MPRRSQICRRAQALRCRSHCRSRPVWRPCASCSICQHASCTAPVHTMLQTAELCTHATDVTERPLYCTSAIACKFVTLTTAETLPVTSSQTPRGAMKLRVRVSHLRAAACAAASSHRSCIMARSQATRSIWRRARSSLTSASALASLRCSSMAASSAVCALQGQHLCQTTAAADSKVFHDHQLSNLHK